MEGVFAFFLESAFLGLFLYGEKRLGPKGHWWAGFAVFLGSWISGFFITATNAWMQHPVAFTRAADGSFQLASFRGLLLNSWAWWQYTHAMSGALITGSFVMASVGAFYLLSHRHELHGRIFVKVGVVAGVIFCIFQLFPTGDGQGFWLAQKRLSKGRFHWRPEGLSAGEVAKRLEPASTTSPVLEFRAKVTRGRTQP